NVPDLEVRLHRARHALRTCSRGFRRRLFAGRVGAHSAKPGRRLRVQYRAFATQRRRIDHWHAFARLAAVGFAPEQGRPCELQRAGGVGVVAAALFYERVFLWHERRGLAHRVPCHVALSVRSRRRDKSVLDAPRCLIVGSDGMTGSALLARLRREGIHALGTSRRTPQTTDTIPLDLASDPRSWRIPAATS